MRNKYLGEEFYPDVRWFEPDTDKIRKMRFGIVIPVSCFLLQWYLLLLLYTRKKNHLKVDL